MHLGAGYRKSALVGNAPCWFLALRKHAPGSLKWLKVAGSTQFAARMSSFGKDAFGKEWSKDRENVASISAGLREFREGRDFRDGRLKQVMPPSFDVDSENNFFDTEGDMELDTVDGNPTEKHVDADFYNSKQS